MSNLLPAVIETTALAAADLVHAASGAANTLNRNHSGKLITIGALNAASSLYLPSLLLGVNCQFRIYISAQLGYALTIRGPAAATVGGFIIGNTAANTVNVPPAFEAGNQNILLGDSVANAGIYLQIIGTPNRYIVMGTAPRTADATFT